MIEIFNSLHWKCTKALHQLPYQVYSCNIVTINTRSKSDFSTPQVNTVYFGQNSIRYLGPLIWNSIPTALRNVESSVQFKSLIKNCKQSNCLLLVNILSKSTPMSTPHPGWEEEISCFPVFFFQKQRRNKL